MEKKKILIILASLIVILSVSCNFPLINQVSNTDQNSDPQSTLPEITPASMDDQQIFTYEFSADQSTLIGEKGLPTRFSIIFTNDNRQETWYYDTSGYTYMFSDGNIIAEKKTSPRFQENMYGTTYSPEQFSRGMGFDEILQSTGKEEFSISEIEGLNRDSHLMHLEGLSIGLLEGKINMVETYPAMTERKLTPEEFPVSETIELTTAEIANSGVHKYLVVVYLNDEYINQLESTLELTFDAGTLIITENNVTSLYSRLEPNRYNKSDGSAVASFNLDGFVILEEGENGSVEVLYSRIDD